MTAGQRNCYICLQNLVESYGIGTAMLAVQELIRDAQREVPERSRPGHAYEAAIRHIDQASQWCGRAETLRMKGGAT